MGAFFLHKTEEVINLGRVEELFSAKGFSAPCRHVFGAWSLLHYPKQLMADKSFFVNRPDSSLFAVGTFTYKSHGLQKSLESVLDDFLAGQLDQKALVGAYCLLVCIKDQITFLTDEMNLFHVFTNENHTIFSSSFAAVLKAGPNTFPLNVAALIENAITGYIIGPETIVRGISLVNAQYRKTICCSGISFSQPSPSNRLDEPTADIRIDVCVDEQLAELDRYFAMFTDLVAEVGGVDIGLSGGYDSRLLLLMAKRHFTNIRAHTHFHRATTADENIAEKLAAALDVPLYLCSEAKQPAEMDIEEFERNMDNVAAYNDARVIHDYSWLVYFRTRWYRESVLGDLRFGMNGLAGELYRNHDNHYYNKVNTREWMQARVLSTGVCTALAPQALNNTLDYILAKAGVALGADLSHTISHHETRRYFGELFSVYGAAVRMNIDNQLAFSLSPFMDNIPRMASYRTLPHLGLAGQFEAAMIRRLNPVAARIGSTYGYAFDRREPTAHSIKYVARGAIPNKLQNTINAVRFMNMRPTSKAYEAVSSQQPLVRRAAELMTSACFGLNLEKAAHNQVFIMRTISIGVMLLKYEDSIAL